MKTVSALLLVATATLTAHVPEHRQPPKVSLPTARPPSLWVGSHAVDVHVSSIGSTCWVTVTRLQPEITDDELRQIARRRVSDWLRQRHVSLRECSVNIETRCDESVLLTVYY